MLQDHQKIYKILTVDDREENLYTMGRILQEIPNIQQISGYEWQRRADFHVGE